MDLKKFDSQNLKEEFFDFVKVAWNYTEIDDFLNDIPFFDSNIKTPKKEKNDIKLSAETQSQNIEEIYRNYKFL